jgi:hypothetical protein
MPAPLFGAAARVLGTSAIAGLAGFTGNQQFSNRLQQGLMNYNTSMGTSLANVAFGATKAGIALASIGGWGSTIVKVTRALEGFATNVLLGNRQYDFLSPQIASAFARLDYNTLRNNARTAAGTAGTTNTLANAVMRMQDVGQPLQQATRNLENVMATFAAMLATAIMNSANNSGFTGKLGHIAKMLDFAARGGLQTPHLNTEDYRQFVRQMMIGNFGKPFNQTPGKEGRF